MQGIRTLRHPPMGRVMSELRSALENLVSAAEDVIKIDQAAPGEYRLPGCTDDSPCDSCMECVAYMYLADMVKRAKQALEHAAP